MLAQLLVTIATAAAAATTAAAFRFSLASNKHRFTVNSSAQSLAILTIFNELKKCVE